MNGLRGKIKRKNELIGLPGCVAALLVGGVGCVAVLLQLAMWLIPLALAAFVIKWVWTSSF